MPAETLASVSIGRLPQDLPAIRTIRQQVFIEEQGIPARLEWDGQDAACRHVLAWDRQHQPVGTGRLGPDGRIGRMAVLKPWRGNGIGGAILETLLRLALEQGHTSVYVLAQSTVTGFYREAGFLEQGQPFLEAGIEHVKMTKTLPAGNNKKKNQDLL